MRLVAQAELTVPDRVDLWDQRAALVSRAGVFSTVAFLDGGERFALMSITDRAVAHVVLDELGAPHTEAYDTPAPLLLDDDALGVVTDARTLRVYDSGLRLVRTVPISGVEVLEPLGRHGQLPRLTACASRGATGGEHPLVLDEAIRTGNPRLIAFLRVAEDHARWTRTVSLDPDRFPADRFGFDDLPDFEAEPCIVGDAVGQGHGLLVCVEGSDGSSVPRYGMDFFTVARLNADGTVADTVYQQSGWKRQAGKHGIRGKITSSGRYVVLTPVFASGEWKGKQRLLDLATGEVMEPVPPRGASKLRIIDHGAGGFWLSDGARRLMRAEPEA